MHCGIELLLKMLNFESEKIIKKNEKVDKMTQWVMAPVDNLVTCIHSRDLPG